MASISYCEEVAAIVIIVRGAVAAAAAVIDSSEITHGAEASISLSSSSSAARYLARIASVRCLSLIFFCCGTDDGVVCSG